MDDGGPLNPCIIPDAQTEEQIRRLLEGDATLDQVTSLPTVSEGYLEGQTRLLHILNLTFKAVREERIIMHALERIGTRGKILYIPKEDPTCPYHQAVLDKGRLLLPSEYGSLLTSYEGLEILFQNAVASQDQEHVQMVLQKAEALVPHKAIVLARMFGHTYESVLREFIESSGAVELLDTEQFVDFVATRVPELEARGECRLQLSRELVTMDNLLTMAEIQRTPENRAAFLRDIMGTAPEYHFVYQNNLRSKHFYEAYPERFPVDELERPMIKWKCEGECMGCPNWKKTLTKKGPRYGHM